MSECKELCGCGMPCLEGAPENHRVVGGGELLHACAVHWPRDVPGAIGVTPVSPFQEIVMVTGPANDLVAYGEMPKFNELPEVVIWGNRTFKLLREPTENIKAAYKEVFAVAVVKWKLHPEEEATYNGGIPKQQD